jgi:hypothetical protein
VLNTIDSAESLRGFLAVYNIDTFLNTKSLIRYEITINKIDYFWEYTRGKVVTNYPFSGMSGFDFAVTTGSDVGTLIIRFRLEETLNKINKMDYTLLKDKKLVGLIEEFKHECIELVNRTKNIDKRSLQVDKEAYRLSELSSVLIDAVSPYMVRSPSLYIPAERIISVIFPDLWFAQFTPEEFNKFRIPKYFTNFLNAFMAVRYQKDRYFTVEELRMKFGMDENKFLYEYEEGEMMDVKEAASGVQSVLPIAKVLNWDTMLFYSFYLIEEPELNLFPKSQDELIRYIIRYASAKIAGVLLTTHSPYVLTSLDNLILAHNVASENPNLKKAIAQIIPEQYWLDYNRVQVYSFNPSPKKGEPNTESLMNDDRRGINGNTIDSVSEELSEIFDKLLELRYN